jgi:uncharacterized protein (UPF0332 family)
MGYHHDLIQHAIFLSELNLPDEPKQVDLRRAVSAAYYSLFHLLTTEAAENWKHERHRHDFARMFDHGRMKSASTKTLPNPIGLVARSFVKLQEARHKADYDNSIVWSRAEVWEMLAVAEDAMAVWSNIRQQEVAQDYLLALFDLRRKG